jgi:hypothetical protein
MTVTINLPPEKEQALKAQAQGLSVEEWLLRLAEWAAAEPTLAQKRFDNLSDLLLASPFAGADLNLERRQDYPRPVEVE